MNNQKNNLIQALKLAGNLGSAQNNPKKHLLLIDLNNHLKSFEVHNNQDFIAKFNQPNIIFIIRVYLVDPKSINRQHAIAFFRYILNKPQVTQLYKRYHIPIFIARSLERQIKQQKNGEIAKVNLLYQEVLQSLKFMRKWIQISPQNFPKFLLNSLVAFVQQPIDDNNKKINLDENSKRFALETLRILVSHNSKICSWSGAIKVLIQAAIDPIFQDLSDSIVCTFLLLLNQSQNRQQLGVNIDLTKFFSIFTEIDYDFESNSFKDNMKVAKTKFQAQLSMAKKAIIIIIKSWTGLIYLGHEQIAIRSLIETLRQPVCKQVRVSIFQILQQLLNLGNIHIINKYDNVFAIQSLIKCYLVILVQMLLNCNLFKILVQLNGLEDQSVVTPSKKLLKQLTTIMFGIIPNSTKYTDFIITAASENLPKLRILKSCASSIVNTMGNYIFQSSYQKNKKIKSKLMFNIQNLYLNTQLAVPSYSNNNQTFDKLRSLMINDTDENKLLTLVKSSNVLQIREDNWKKWNWEDIHQILELYLQKTQRIDILIKNRFLKKILRFFQPSKRLFVSLNWHTQNFIYIKVGYLLIKKLIRKHQCRQLFNEFQQKLDIGRSFLADINHTIKDHLNGDKKAEQIVGQQAIMTKLSRQLFSWIGIFTQTQIGLQMLKQNNLIQTIGQLINKGGSHDYLLNLLIYSMDYFQQSASRQLLQMCLQKGSFYLKKIVLQLIRMLFRFQSTDFRRWGMKAIINSIKEDNALLISKALETLQDIMIDNNGLNNDLIQEFFKSHPPIQKLKLSQSFILVASSTKQGFMYLNNNNWLQTHLQGWQKQYSKEYCQKVEKCLKDVLNFAPFQQNNYTFRMPGMSSDCLHSYFLYRIPWLLTVNTQTYYISLSLPSPIISLYKNIPFSELQPISICLLISNINLDNYCNDYLQPYKIKFFFQDLKMIEQENNEKVIRKGGVMIKVRKQQQKWQAYQFHLSVETEGQGIVKIPIHAFGQIAKTKKGIELLRKYKWTEKLKDSLNSQKKIEVRAALWTIGNIGMSSYGIQLIKQCKLISKVMDMAINQKCLSLRGSSIYIVNMLCKTTEGRVQIQSNRWTVFWNSNLGWICIPCDQASILNIQQSKSKIKTQWAMQQNVWKNFYSLKDELQLQQHEMRFLQSIGLLSNSLTNKSGYIQIMSICKQKPNALKSKVLFYCVMVMLGMYHLKQQSRKFIFLRFDQMFKNPNILSILDENTPQLIYDLA